jgi:hypothetical protein
MTNKEKILDVIQRLPEEVAYDRVIDEICVLQKIEIGLRQVEEGDVISHEDLKRHFQTRVG